MASTYPWQNPSPFAVKIAEGDSIRLSVFYGGNAHGYLFLSRTRALKGDSWLKSMPEHEKEIVRPSR